MEKRALLAIVLSVLVLLAFKYFVDRQAVQQARLRPPAAQAPAATLPPPAAQTAEAIPAPPATPKIPAATTDTKAAPASVGIEGSLYRAVLNNRGAVITSWQLRKYQSATGEPFEMVAPGKENAYPGSVVFEDPQATAVAANDNYELQVVEGQEHEGTIAPPATVVLRLRKGPLSFEKRYRFEKDNYVVDLIATYERDGKPLPGHVLLAQDIGPEKEHLFNPSMQLTGLADLGGKIQRESTPKDPNEVKRVSGDVRWAGLDMQYFTIIAIPQRPFAAVDLQKKTVKVVGLEGNEISRDLLRVTVPSDGMNSFGLYLGPKRRVDLESVNGVDLSGVINYGMFSFLVVPLLVALRWIDTFTHNYGWAIIVLTLLLTVALFPLRLKQMLSMKKMSVVQPKIKAIQEKYRKYKKTDPKRAEMNQEVMAIYKEHGVNPLGGCLPLLVQMPLLYAFYSLLAYSIELRHAPFALWIHDLSVKDPYYVLPIVMGISMFISQKMTPMAPGADPAQAKMMMFMPVVLTFMFLNLSSGLNLYFLCSNIFQIGFQKISERWIGDGRSRVKSQV